MDMSKLPRLSDTQREHKAHASASGAASDPPPQRQYVPATPPPEFDRSVGPEVWMSVIFGLIFLFMGWNFARYAIATLTGQPFHTNVTWSMGPRAGQEVEYFELQGGVAYTQAGMFLFGLALLLEAVAMLIAHRGLPFKRGLVAFALLVTLLATAFNLFVAIKIFGMGMFPLMSALAVAFGGYIAAYEWRMLQALNAHARGGVA